MDYLLVAFGIMGIFFAVRLSYIVAIFLLDISLRQCIE
jgi:hypothetical protein